MEYGIHRVHAIKDNLFRRIVRESYVSEIREIRRIGEINSGVAEALGGEMRPRKK